MKKASDGTKGAVLSRNAHFKSYLRQLFRKHGPMFTRDLYPLVLSQYPSLCNDDDWHGSGSKQEPAWKHAVRAAQESIAKNGEIVRLDDGRWSGVDHRK